MIYVFQGDDKAFGLELSPPADQNSVAYSLRDNQGNLIPSVSGVSVENADQINYVLLKIAGANNTITAPLTNESRFLQVVWTSLGITQERQINYVVTPFMPIRVQENDVRSIVGASQVEIPNNDIDIVSAAMYVRNDVTPTIFDAALVSGNLATRQVNQLITLWSAFELAPSIQLRMAALEKNELAQFSRFVNLDMMKWLEDIKTEYYRIRGNLIGPPLVPNPTFLSFGPTRPVFLPPWVFLDVFPLIPPITDVN